ncbi:MAG: hypothetical protein V4691_10960 [Pseudomonadota bacterium]
MLRPFGIFALAALLGLTCTTDAFSQAKPKRPDVAATKITIPPPGPAEVPLFGAREFTDSRSNLEMTIPAGWLVIEIPRLPKDSISMIMMEGPGSPAPTCRLGVRAPKQPPKIAQAQINKIMHDGRNLAMVKNNLAKDGREVVAVNKLVIKGINGVQAQVLVPGNERRPDVTLLVNFFETVGRAYSMECTVMAADYDNMSKDIDALIKSLRFANS